MLQTALEAALAFNLVCSGTLRTGPLGLALPEANGEPFSITYRIDLDAGLWCSDVCETTERLTVTLGVIMLREERRPSGSHLIMVSPATGTFNDTRIDGNTATLRSGTCERAAFTGLFGRTA